MAVSANRLELLQIVDAVAREKSIDRSIVLASMEDAMQKAARSRYGQETEVRAEINPKTGEIRFSRLLLVVEEVENDATQMTLTEAQKKNPSAQIGDWIAESLPPFDYGRIPAQASKQVLVQKIREAERDKQYDVYKDRIGDIINGAVKRVEYGNVVVDLGGSGAGEAVVRRDELIPREMFRPGDRIRAYVYDVRREARGPQIFLSRTHPQFTSKLFTQEVPEIYDGIVEVRSVARDPGSRAKIAVMSNNSSIDPVGACVGMRGSRVQAVVNELQGEKIDIIPWSPDAATFIVNALQPAEVMKVVLDEDSTRIEVVVPDDQLSLAIGRRGQNVRLASQLTGWDIDILTEAEESERRQKEFAERTQTFMDALDVDETVAQLLASEGFRTVDEIAYVEPRELASIEGFDDDTAAEIQARAQGHLARIEAEFDDQRKALGVVGRSQGARWPHHPDAGQARRERRQDARGYRRLRQRRPRRLDRAERKRRDGEARLPQRLRHLAGTGRRHDPGRARARRLDRGARASGRRRSRGKRRRLNDAGIVLLRTASLSDETGSERTCIVTGSKGAPEAMLRFALGPDGSVVPDIRRKLPGRGVWTRLSSETVNRAAAKQAFSRAFRAKAEAPASLAAAVDALLERDALQSLSIANKAGLVVAGAFKVDAAIESGGVTALIQASDGAPDGAAKRAQVLTAKLGREAKAVAPVDLFSSRQLDLALGQDKCDTCCSQTRCSEFGLPREGGSFAPLSRERSGRDNQDRARRRAGR